MFSYLFSLGANCYKCCCCLFERFTLSLSSIPILLHNVAPFLPASSAPFVATIIFLYFPFKCVNNFHERHCLLRFNHKVSRSKVPTLDFALPIHFLISFHFNTTPREVLNTFQAGTTSLLCDQSLIGFKGNKEQMTLLMFLLFEVNFLFFN